ncbi:MAG: magnesium transporter [Pseudomonadales bacterium]|nr:magnesium transporter [Pseudomonadales bacterium]
MLHRDSATTKEQLLNLNEALDSGAFVQVRRILNRSLPAVDVAHLLESSPPKVRNILWNLIDRELGGEILQHLSEDISSEILSKMNPQELADVTSGLDLDDIADLLQQLPDQLIQEVLRSMDSQNRQRLEQVLSYPEDTAGGLMNIDTITVRPDITIDVVLRYLRLHPKIPDMTDNLPVVNRKDELVGILPISKILVSDPSSTVRELMNTDVITITAEMPELEVAQLFERHDLVSAPVVDQNRKLLGRITIDDVVDVIREEADHSFMGMAGLDEDEDTFAPIFKTAKRRSVWLFINLLTAFLASYVIGLFEAAIDKVVALAILMPIVASMGGVAGSQTLALMIRGIALGHVAGSNTRWLIRREAIVGLISGLIWAVVVAAVATWWFKDNTIGIVIALAVIINLVVAAIAGASLPSLLRTFGIDPAIAGSVVLTTITDVVGFMAFLGLATLFYA